MNPSKLLLNVMAQKKFNDGWDRSLTVFKVYFYLYFLKILKLKIKILTIFQIFAPNVKILFFLGKIYVLHLFF